MLVLALVSSASAGTAVLKERARLREAPNGQSPVRSELPAGTHVDVKSANGGWRLIETPDGSTGYIWGEHLTESGEPAHAEPEPAARAEPAESGSSRGLADEVHALRAEVAALRDRPDGGNASDLERIRAELERLAAADRDLARRLEEHGVAAPAPRDAGGDPLPGGSVLLLAGGALVGWAASRLSQRRRDRRQRNRLRL